MFKVIIYVASMVVMCHAKLFSFSSCAMGTDCSNCPEGRYLKRHNGSLICCHGCTPSILSYDEEDHTGAISCYCYNAATRDKHNSLLFGEAPTRGTQSGRILHNPGNNNNNNNNNIPPAGTNRIGTANHLTTVPRQVQDALQVLAEAIEELHIRIKKIERNNLSNNNLDDIINRIKRLEHLHNIGQSVNRLGLESSSLMVSNYVQRPMIENGCASDDFKEIGQHCYHFSAWRDHRAVWTEANKTCGELGGKLAEILSHRQYLDLVNHIRKNKTLPGYSYWLGAVYPGLDWYWINDGRTVFKSLNYWTSSFSDPSNGYDPPSPSNIEAGRCLALQFVYNKGTYAFQPDQCGYERFYICEQLKKGHRTY